MKYKKGDNVTWSLFPGQYEIKASKDEPYEGDATPYGGQTLPNEGTDYIIVRTDSVDVDGRSDKDGFFNPFRHANELQLTLLPKVE